MRKSLIALAALAAAGAASAQSSVTIWGVADVGYSHGSGSISSKNQVSNANTGSSQLGFKGIEDLGGGMFASFWYELGVNADNGTGQSGNASNQAQGAALANGLQGLMFNRRSTVSIGGNWGELRLGRDYSPSYWNLANYDPHGNLGVAAGQNYIGAGATIGSTLTGVRVSNSIQYIFNQPKNEYARGNTPNIGLNGNIAYYLGENNSGAGTSNDGKGFSARIGYNMDGLSVALGSGKTTYAAGDIKQGNIGASYEIGAHKIMAQYSSDKNGAIAGKGYLVGAALAVGGAGQVRLSYGAYKTDAAGTPTGKKMGLGYVHNLSKRTALYATYADLKNSGGLALGLNGSVTGANTSSNGFDFGVRTSW